MGLGSAPGGITLRFLNRDGSERRPPLTGAHVKLFSTPRTKRLDGLQPNLSGSELGSKDWLTDVIVADTPEKLAAMKPLLHDTALSSLTSRRVFVQYNITDPQTGKPDEGSEMEAVTVAPPDKLIHEGSGRSLTTELHVFPKGTLFGIPHVDDIRAITGVTTTQPALGASAISTREATI